MKQRKATHAPPLTEAVDLGPAIRRVPIYAADGALLRDATTAQAEWADPHDTNPQRREARRVSASRAADPLVAMMQRGKLITDRHIKAAGKLLDDWECGVLGAKPGGGKAFGSGASGGFQAAQYPEEARLAHLSSARAAQAAVGVTGFRILAHVVLGIPSPENRSVRAYAVRHDMHEQTATGLLFASLERLAEHYNPRGRNGIADENEQKARSAE